MKRNTFKKYFFTGVLSIVMLTAAACGKDQTTDEPGTAATEQNATDNGTTTDAGTAQTDGAENGAVQENPGVSEDTAAPEEPAAPSDVTVTMDEFYGDTRCAMHFLGLQEYEKLEGEDFTDTPEEGYRYLVLFLQIENRTESEDYFNTELLSAALDGEEITNSFLINAPESYSTIFTNIPAQSNANGFIVWQVPTDWQTLELTYRGWEGSGNIIVHAALTPEDMQAPPTLDENE